MSDSFDIGGIVFVCIVLICFLGIYVWLWRGRFLSRQLMPRQLLGFRLEEHRRQLWSATGRSLCPLGLLVLLAADLALDLCHLSHTRHAFWSGMIVASDLWLVALMSANVVAAIRRFQSERSDLHHPDLRDHA